MGEFYKGGPLSPGLYQMNCNITKTLENEDDKKCLEDRKYWCFLLSSIVTFCACMLLVVIWRVLVHFCCRQKENGDVAFDDGMDNGVSDGPINGQKAIKQKHNNLVEDLKQELVFGEGPPQPQAEEVQIGISIILQ